MKKSTTFYLLSFFIISLFLYTASLNNFISFSIFPGVTNTVRAILFEKAYAQKKDSSYEKLLSENAKLKEQLLQIENIKKDNVALRSQFQETFVAPTRLIPAKIIGFQGKFTAPSSIFIDQGERAGIVKNSAVVVGKDLIGKVGKVKDYNAEVILTNSTAFSTLASTNKTNASGIVTGQEDFLLFDHVVITDTLQENDLVLTKGEVFENGAIIPEGLMIGRIKDVQKLETKPFQSAVVTLPLDIKKQITVFVVIE